MSTFESSPASTSEEVVGVGHRTARVNETVTAEYDHVVDEVEGRLPEGLTGTYYRNGPGKNDVGGIPYGHIFDGDGMLSQFVLANGKVHFRNRFVRTQHFLAEHDADRPKMRGFGTQRPGGVLANAGRMMANVANTNVHWHGDKLLATWEGGRPWELDPDTLETIGEYDFGGSLRKWHWFSAHAKIDPRTGELFNFGLDPSRATPRVRCYRVEPNGRLSHLGRFSMPFKTYIHDFALTTKYLVFVVDPLISRLSDFVFGRTSMDRSLHFNPKESTHIILIPRDGGKPLHAECPAFLHFHVNNAFDDRDTTVVDLVHYDDDFQDWDNYHGLRDHQATDPFVAGSLRRVRVSAGGEVEIEQLCDRAGEFPQHDWRRTAQEHRYGYMAGASSELGPQSAVVKIDHRTGATQIHEFGHDSAVGEPFFVPRAPEAPEDDGWILTHVYSAREHRTRLVVLDARDIEQEPLFVAHLRTHIPLGFHGTFTKRIAGAAPPSRA